MILSQKDSGKTGILKCRRTVPPGPGMQKFGSARLAAGRRPPSVRLSKCFCGRLQIVPKAPSVKKSEHSARRGPPNSRGTHVVDKFIFSCLCVFVVPGAGGGGALSPRGEENPFFAGLAAPKPNFSRV